MLTKIISIDNVKNNQVFAYANKAEFENFKALGYQYTIIPNLAAQSKSLTMATSVDSMKNWNRYPTYEVYTQMMRNFATAHPDICRLDTIGNTNAGRQMLFLKISSNVNQNLNKPEFFYSSTMHGDEVIGFTLMLRLIDYIINNYNKDAKVTNLVNNVEMWICPDFNPDGTYHGGNSSVAGAQRYNYLSQDLNRTFPQAPAAISGTYPTEVQNMMNFMNKHHFVNSANFHSGDEVVNYPWDAWQKRHPDDAWYQHISREFADSTHVISSSYMSETMVPGVSGDTNGITDGIDWYQVLGGLQDYCNWYKGCRDVTIEMSFDKLLAVESLPTYWTYLKSSFINFIAESLYGIRGIVTNDKGLPLDAQITISNHDTDNSQVSTDPEVGDYHRLIAPGTYSMTISSSGYISQTFTNITVSNYQTTIINAVLKQAQAYNFSGVVYNGYNSMPIDSAKINIQTTPTQQTTTDKNGKFALQGILENLYSVTVSKTNFATVMQIDTISAKDTLAIFILLPVHPLSFEDSVIPSQFSMSGNAPWTISNATASDGRLSLKSGFIGDSQTSAVSYSKTTPAGTISFYERVSSETGFDFLNFYIDGVKTGAWSGNGTWTQQTYNITAGSHVFKWEYAKDESTSMYQDCAWIDYIVLPEVPSKILPAIISQPNVNAIKDSVYNYNIVANDVNFKDTLKISCIQKPSWLTFTDYGNRIALLTGKPAITDTGSVSISLAVTNKKDTVYQNYTLKVFADAVESINDIQLPKDELTVAPNPATNYSLITVRLQSTAFISLDIFDLYGKQLRSFINHTSLHDGNYYFNLKTDNLANGIYFCRLQIDGRTIVKKIIVAK